MQKARQAIHTYPFRYRPMTADEVFRPTPASVYIHVPFCTQKCHFCDFTVRTNSSDDLRRRYVEAVAREIEIFAATSTVGALSVEAIYLGGGTPSLLEADQLTGLVEACRKHLALSDDVEIGVEFEPGSVTEEKLAKLRAAGMSRASMGVQSLDDTLLAGSNRAHRAADVYRALDMFAAEGVRNVNLDLMYPLPGLTERLWSTTVDQLIEIHPAAVSLYALEVWADTAFGRRHAAGRLDLPGPDTEVSMYLDAVRALEAAGYEAESVNGYVDHRLTPRYSRYLDFYWRMRPVIGFGVSSRSAFGGTLWRNCTGLTGYLAAIGAGRLPIDLGLTMTKPQEMRRFMVRGLKALTVTKADFAERFGVPMDAVFGAELARLVAAGAVVDTGTEVRLTHHGRAFAPNVYQHFFTDTDLRSDGPQDVLYGVSSWTARPPR
jgi:oxygen-independent coproporphyrinogen-3 oxidase